MEPVNYITILLRMALCILQRRTANIQRILLEESPAISRLQSTIWIISRFFWICCGRLKMKSRFLMYGRPTSHLVCSYIGDSDVFKRRSDQGSTFICVCTYAFQLHTNLVGRRCSYTQFKKPRWSRREAPHTHTLLLKLR